MDVKSTMLLLKNQSEPDNLEEINVVLIRFSKYHKDVKYQCDICKIASKSFVNFMDHYNKEHKIFLFFKSNNWGRMALYRYNLVHKENDVSHISNIEYYKNRRAKAFVFFSNDFEIRFQCDICDNHDFFTFEQVLQHFYKFHQLSFDFDNERVYMILNIKDDKNYKKDLLRNNNTRQNSNERRGISPRTVEIPNIHRDVRRLTPFDSFDGRTNKETYDERIYKQNSRPFGDREPLMHENEMVPFEDTSRRKQLTSRYDWEPDTHVKSSAIAFHPKKMEEKNMYSGPFFTMGRNYSPKNLLDPRMRGPPVDNVDHVIVKEGLPRRRLSFERQRTPPQKFYSDSSPNINRVENDRNTSIQGRNGLYMGEYAPGPANENHTFMGRVENLSESKLTPYSVSGGIIGHDNSSMREKPFFYAKPPRRFTDGPPNAAIEFATERNLSAESKFKTYFGASPDVSNLRNQNNLREGKRKSSPPYQFRTYAGNSSNKNLINSTDNTFPSQSTNVKYLPAYGNTTNENLQKAARNNLFGNPSNEATRKRECSPESQPILNAGNPSNLNMVKPNYNNPFKRGRVSENQLSNFIEQSSDHVLAEKAESSADDSWESCPYKSDESEFDDDNLVDCNKAGHILGEGGNPEEELFPEEDDVLNIVTIKYTLFTYYSFECILCTEIFKSLLQYMNHLRVSHKSLFQPDENDIIKLYLYSEDISVSKEDFETKLETRLRVFDLRARRKAELRQELNTDHSKLPKAIQFKGDWIELAVIYYNTTTEMIQFRCDVCFQDRFKSIKKFVMHAFDNHTNCFSYEINREANTKSGTLILSLNNVTKYQLSVRSRAQELQKLKQRKMRRVEWNFIHNKISQRATGKALHQIEDEIDDE